MNLTVTDVATEIYNEEVVTGMAIPAITYWLRNNIGALNSLINSEYVLAEGTYEFSPEISEESKAILKQMFLVYFYGKKVTESLGAAALNSVLEVSEEGATVRMVNRNELSKTYLSLKKDTESALQDMVNAYKINVMRAKQIVGDDDQTTYGISPLKEINRLH